MSSNLAIFYLFGIAATLLASGGTYFFSRKSRHEIARWVFWIFIAASGYIFFAQYLKYQSLHMYTDFAHWLGIFKSIVAEGKPLLLTHEFIAPGTLHYFSVHFVSLIYILAVPFKLILRPETIIFLNVALMLSAVIPLYKLALHMRKDKRFALFAATLFLWYPTFQYITLYEFEMLRFSIPILLWMLYFFETRRVFFYALFVLLAILVREEMGLTVAMFGVYSFLFAKRRKRGFLTLVAGLVGFLFITSKVMPAFRTAGVYQHIASGYFLPFGVDFVSVLKGVLAHPFLALQVMFEPIKIANIFMLGLPFLFLPLLGASALISTLANVGMGLLSNADTHSSYMLYYIAPSVPFIFYAFLKGWHSLTLPFPLGRGGGERVRQWLGHRHISEGALMNALLAAMLTSNIFFGPSPISLQFWFKNIRPAPFHTQDFHRSVYRVTDHHRKVDEFVRLIPDEAIVSAPQFLLPRLYKKRGTMVFPALQSKDKKWQTEYILLDITNNGLKPESPAYVTQEKMAVVRESEEWELTKVDDGYELYKKTSDG